MASEKLRAIIAEQQKGHEGEPLYMVGMQLLGIAEKEPDSAELLEADLQTSGMGLAAAAGELKKYADTHHGKAKCFCITPDTAEKILRGFYHLPEKKADGEEKPADEEGSADDFIDLSAFL